jgi:DNA-binding transcriptional ArsR family regulator
MLRYELNEADVGDIKFGVSPLCEMGLSLRALKEPDRFPLQAPWLARTAPARAGADIEVLLALIDDRLWTPDFLNPRPASPLTRLGGELAALGRLDPRSVLGQLEELHGTVPRPFTGSPAVALRRIVTALADYWERAFEPHWPRMRSILQADIVHRGRRVAQGGLATMLNEISPEVTFADNVVAVRNRSLPAWVVPAGGRGLTLVPTMFANRASVPLGGDEPPLILYSARGQGVMWQAEKPVTVAAVAALLGRTRTALLLALAEPASSTELGLRFDVTTSAVNQHLRALQSGGLVTSTRYGHSVLYFRSELGTALVERG